MDICQRGRYQMMNTDPIHRPGFISKLLEPAAYPHGVHGLQLVETHISWVILTGDYAYKVKKPVKLGFLDFLKFGYQSYDITDAFSEFWPRARESMLALKDDFESEGNGYICKHWLREANEEFLPAMEANELRRYLYIVRV